MSTALAKEFLLNSFDRCDRCGSQAYVLVKLLSGGSLIFCGHHAKEHEDKLKLIALEYIDETERL
jgi:ribosomal protein L37E